MKEKVRYGKIGNRSKEVILAKLIEIYGLSKEKALKIINTYNNGVEYANAHRCKLCDVLEKRCLCVHRLLCSNSDWDYPEDQILAYILRYNPL